MRNKFFILICLAWSFLTGCSENHDCGEYETWIDAGSNNGGQTTGGCNQVRYIYIGTYYENYPDLYPSYSITAGDSKNKIVFNGLFYAEINKDDLHSLVFPEQWFTVTGGSQSHLTNGYGSCDGNILTVNYTVVNSGQTVTATGTFTRH